MATQLGCNIIRRLVGSRLLAKAGGNLGARGGLPGIRGVRSYSSGSTSSATTPSEWWVGTIVLTPVFLWWLDNRRVAALKADQKEQLEKLLPEKQLCSNMMSKLRDKYDEGSKNLMDIYKQWENEIKLRADEIYELLT